VLRLEQPFRNHNAGHLAFNPLASPGDADFGMLYVGVADGGSGGDPLDLSQDPNSIFGKIIRIDPLASDADNGAYGIPSDNPFVGRSGVLPEIFVSGVRNPQRFGWDEANGNLFVADIGQNQIEELSLAWAGADLGWNSWEGSYGFISRQELDMSAPRSDPDLSYPIVEYDHEDPILIGRAAITGVVAYRHDAIPQLTGRLLFADYPSGEIFHVSADDLPDGGEDEIRRVLLRDGSGAERTFLDLIQAKNREQGRDEATRTDIRFATGPDGRFFLLNKHDGVIRELVR
jgi:glucose/arabinose dehydrogenase